jgi:hypothetical protein
VNNDGLVTAIDNGKATITATTKGGDYKANCVITVDFCSQWVGEWEFEVVYSWFIMDVGSGRDTIYYLGKISLLDAPNRINIAYAKNFTINLNVHEDGGFYAFPSDLSDYRGSFEGNNKIKLYLRWGGLGGGTSHTINGTKLERRTQ